MKVKIVWIACLLLFLGTQVSYAQRARPKNGRKAAIAKKKMATQNNKTQNKAKMQKKMKGKAMEKAKAKAKDKKNQENASGQGASQASAGQARGSSQKARIKVLSSLQLSDDLLLALDSVQVNAFQVDESGILKPNPGYHMGFHEGKNKIFIKSVEVKFDKSIMQNEPEEIAPGILLFCLDANTSELNNEGEEDMCNEFITLTPSSEIQQMK